VRDARLCAVEPFEAVAEAEVADLLARSIDGWAEDAAPREVSFVVHGEDARWVPGNLPSAGMKVETLGGGIRVRAVTSAMTPLARFVVGLGAAARAETPELAERVEELARGAIARAGRGTGVAKARYRAGKPLRAVRGGG
jgi:hypothetical protein